MVSGKYFNRGVKTIDNPDIGYVVRETPDKIIVFGGKDSRYDIPISEIQQVGANVLIGLPFSEVEKRYRANEMILFQPVELIHGKIGKSKLI